MMGDSFIDVPAWLLIGLYARAHWFDLVAAVCLAGIAVAFGYLFYKAGRKL